jgi:hypothetical protein
MGLKKNSGAGAAGLGGGGGVWGGAGAESRSVCGFLAPSATSFGGGPVPPRKGLAAVGTGAPSRFRGNRAVASG